MKIPVDQIKPGMVAAEAVVDCNGRMLVGRNTEFTEKHLRVMRIWRVMEVEVAGNTAETQPEPSGEADPEVMARAVERVRKRFRHCNPKHPVAKELFRLAVVKLAAEKDEGDRSGKRDDFSLPEDSPSPAPVSLRKLLQQDIKLPSLPSVFSEIQEVINNPRSSAHSIAAVIGKDTGLSARLLRLVNSPLYSFPSRIDSIQRAVTVVGTKQLSTIAMGMSIMNVFKSIPENLVDMTSFWRHSLAVAVIARVTAGLKNLPNSERLFVGGLLHDIGRMVIYNHLPGPARVVLQKAARDGDYVVEVESRVLGFTHSELGAELLQKWKLPVTLESMAQNHHNPVGAPYPLDAAIVHFADVMSNALDVGSSGEHLAPRLDEEAWKMLELPVGAIQQILFRLDHQLMEVGRSFLDE